MSWTVTNDIAKAAGRDYLTPDDIRRSYQEGTRGHELAIEVLEAISKGRVMDAPECARLTWQVLIGKGLPDASVPSNDETRKLWEVWAEGYAATGDHGTASLLGKVRATTFAEACALVAKKVSNPALFDSKKLTYWGCRLFDNERDARKEFG